MIVEPSVPKSPYLGYTRILQSEQKETLASRVIGPLRKRYIGSCLVLFFRVAPKSVHIVLLVRGKGKTCILKLSHLVS